MGEYLVLERFSWFHQEILRNLYPNATTLAEHFELSTRTARRNIIYMRDYLGAPLEYDPVKKGYFYTENSFELPHLQATQEELLAVLLARNLLSHSADGIISRTINSLARKLFAVTGNFGLTERRMIEAFSASWHSYSPVPSEIFEKVSAALLRYHRLVITYTSPKTGQETIRQVEPHHLQHYMGSWVLIAWCGKRAAWRKFFLARMKNVEIEGSLFSPRPGNEWAALLDESYGIFQGGKATEVILRFTPASARWVREQHWHPKQVMRELSGAGLELSVPVADFREIKLKILQFGADVEVVEPAELREEVRLEIMKMSRVY